MKDKSITPPFQKEFEESLKRIIKQLQKDLWEDYLEAQATGN